MVEENANKEGQQQGGEGTSGEPPIPGAPQTPVGVTLSEEQYSAMLDHIATLESKVMSAPQGQQQVQTLDNLVDEAGQGGKTPVVQAPQGTKLEDMSADQVVAHLFQAIQQQYIAPLEVKVETLRIINEIDRLVAKPENADFYEYAPRVREIAIKNPTLSIKEAYHLAKAEGKRDPKAQGDSGLIRKSEVLYTLPKRPNIVGGEKPGAPVSQTRGTGELSRRDAASAAFDAATKGLNKEK